MITGIVTESIYKVASGALQLGENVSGYKLSMAPTQSTVDKTDLYVMLLEKWKLGKYVNAFAKEDWDEVGIWKHLTDEILTNDLGLSSGAVHKFRFHYTKWCEVQNEIESGKEPDNESEKKRDEAKSKTSDDELKYNHLNLRGNWNDNVSRYKAPAMWTMDKTGRVRLHGVIRLKAGGHDELVAVLPEEIHPQHFIYENRVDSRGETVNIRVYAYKTTHGKCGEMKLRGSPNATGIYVGTGSAYISLNGISWYVPRQSDPKKNNVLDASLTDTRVSWYDDSKEENLAPKE